ncbi:MAG TPA: endonuclease/exonuclease/phosphatase family protein [Petrimonas sp.]|jgi:endonuclease/exonuclease/phosphatase family metal-dependent hydrolase|nr:endonuclease/exonuclease/phosphatase family protein [Petrimonas sp.]
MPVKNKIALFRGIVRNIIFATNIIAILLLFSSFLSWRVSPLKTNLFSYIGIAFGFVFFLNISYLFLWIAFKKWKLAFFSLVSLLLCYHPIATFFPMNIFPEKVPRNSLKILTYNVEGFVNENKKEDKEHPILDYIVETDADIVCLQEYLVSKTGQSIKSQRDVNRILNKYPYHSSTALEASGKYHIYGLACFSKYPIEKTHEVVFNSSFNGAAVYTIDVNGKKLAVANVHLESNSISAEDKKLYGDFIQNSDEVNLEDVTSNIRSRLGRAYRMRAEQVRKVKDHLSELNVDGTLICGDFNDTPISYVYAQMKEGMDDAFASTGFGPGITYHKDFFWFRIDNIMHSPNLKSYKAKVDKVPYSDHYPLTTFLNVGD